MIIRGFWIALATACATAAGGADRVRLISTSPEVTELLFQLGKGESVVATSDFSDFPPAARALPRIGPLFMPDLEKTVRISPDWVLLDAANASAAYETGLRAIGQRYLLLDLSRVDRLFSESRRLLGAIYGERDSPRLLAAERCWRSWPDAGKRGRFLAFVWFSPPIAAGAATFLSDLLSRGAGTNAIDPRIRLPYPPLSEDWIAMHPVDSVYFLADDPAIERQARERIAIWWPGRQVRLIALPSAEFSRASFTPFAHRALIGGGEGRSEPGDCGGLGT